MLGGINQSLYVTITRSLNQQTNRIADSLTRLSTGQRLVRPSDDPATSSFLSRLNSQLRGLSAASQNVNRTQGVTSTADAALSNMQDIAVRLREIAVEAANNSLSEAERDLLQEEAGELLQEFQSIPLDTTFDGTKLLDGTFGPVSVQVGPNAGSSFSFSIGDARASQLGKLAIYSGAQGSVAAIGTGASTALTLNGVAIGASTSDGLSTMGASASGLAVANAINLKANDTGVRAEALATEATIYIDGFGGAYSGTFSAGNFVLNDVDITGSISNVGELVDAINDKSSETGVTAEVDSNGDITLIASDGRNIALEISNGTTNAVYDIFNITENQASGLFEATISDAGGSSQYVSGAIQLYSSKSIMISGGATVSASLGIASGLKSLVAGTSATNISVDSEDDAEQAIKILDSVIADISTLRAEIGAVHSRLDMRSAFLVDTQTALEDTKFDVGGIDFALEIANLASAQLLQDASIASLTQANVSRSTVSRLLQGLNIGG